MAKHSKRRHTKRVVRENKIISRILMAVLISAGASLILILLLAFLMYIGWLDISVANVATLVIKIAGALLAAFISTRGMTKSRVTCGIVTGALYIIVAFVVAALLGGGLNINTNLLLDVLTGAAAGAVVGVIGIRTKSGDA